ncbi:hypothetical protein J7E68_00080 [Microbacterium sp. ISL-103]|nr:hypothetical protein [Microbacterium sp. ISL-103]
MQAEPGQPMKMAWPTVFLDQWVWIRFAAVATGRSRDPDDARAYDEVRQASAEGVVFALSATRYEETGRIRDPRQRQDIADVVAPISELRSLRVHNDLVEHQIKIALHEILGRPTFRPSPLQVIGVGAHWSFTGVNAFHRVFDARDKVVDTIDGSWLRQVAQYTEYRLFAGPVDSELPALEKRGYVDPRQLEASATSRLEQERALATQFGSRSDPSATVLRFLQVRELWGTHGKMLARIAQEYGVPGRAIMPDPNARTPFARDAAEFMERIPTTHLMAQLKHGIYRQRREWTWNMLRDIESMSVAIPYTDVVVMDKDAVDLATRVGAPTRFNTTVIARMGELIDVLPDLRKDVNADAEEPPGWERLGPRAPFQLDLPRSLEPEEVPIGAQLRLVGDDGEIIHSPRTPGL